MATVHVVLAQVQARAITGATMPVVNSVPIAAETLTSSGSSAQGTTQAPANSAAIMAWSVTATGGKVWVAFGANPTAVSGAGYLVLDGQTRDFAVTAAGEKIAIKDAA